MATVTEPPALPQCGTPTERSIGAVRAVCDYTRVSGGASPKFAALLFVAVLRGASNAETRTSLQLLGESVRAGRAVVDREALRAQLAKRRDTLHARRASASVR